MARRKEPVDGRAMSALLSVGIPAGKSLKQSCFTRRMLLFIFFKNYNLLRPNFNQVIFSLQNPASDDFGQWDMLANIINKYGLMPKMNFPETYNSENSHKLNVTLRSKVSFL